MLRLHFDDNDLGALSHFTWQRQSNDAGATETWHATLEVHAATPAAMEPQLAALHALVGMQGEVALHADGNVVRALAVADCRDGPVLEGVNERDAAPGEAHNRRKLLLAVRAELQDTDSAVQSHSQALSVVLHTGQPARLRYTGRAVLRRGEDPADHESTLLPVVVAGYRRVKTVTTRDVAAPALAYEAEDERVFLQLPSGVEDGHYVISESTDAQGRTLRGISGFFVGAGALAQANALRAGHGVVRSNPFTRRVDFEFQELLPDAQGHVALTESLAFTTTRRVIDHPLLAHCAPAYRQQVGAPQTQIVQHGSAVGDGRHPSPPAPRYLADLLERHVEYTVPNPQVPPEQRWVTTWRYVARTRGTALHQPPEAP